MKGYLLCFFTLFIFVCGTSAQSNPDSLFNIAEKQAYKNHFAEAKHIMVNLVARYDSDSDYKVFYGALLSWMGKYDSSKAVLRSVIARQPKNLDAYDDLTSVEIWAKDDSMAIIDCNIALTLPKVDSEAYMLKIAEAKKNLQQFPDAYKLTDTLLTKNPGDTSAKNMRVEISAAVLQKTADSLFDSALHSSYRKQYIPAEKIAVQLVHEYPNNSDYKVLWCRLLGYRGKTDTSEIMLKEVIAKEPQNIEAYDAYADDELVTRKFKHSEQLCDTAISMPVKGDRVSLVITKASAQDNLADYYNGLATLDTLVKNQPKNKEAVEMYQLIKVHIKQHQADSLYLLATKEAERRHYDSAHVKVDTITKWYPANTTYQLFKGRLFSYEGKYDTAITIISAVIKKEPHNMDAYDALTDVEMWKPKFALAVEDCDKALADSMFIGYPSIQPKKQDTALTKKFSVRDSLKLDSTMKAMALVKAAKFKKDSLHKDSLAKGWAKPPVPIPDSLLSDTARERMAKDSETHRYYSIFMLKRAHALFDDEKYQGCVNTLDTLRKVDSTNKDANKLLVEAKIKLLKNTLQAGFLLNVFNNAPFGPWYYSWLQYTYNLYHCPLSAKVTYGSIYGLPVGWREGLQYEVGAYPYITRNTSADATVAYSNNFAVFPQWQIAADIIQKLPLGFEASIGGIYMHFIDVVENPPTPPQDVWILDPYIGYYLGENNWQFSYRPYIAYKKPNVYLTNTAVIRHFFGNPDTWVSLYGTYGSSPFVDYYFPSPIATKVEMIGVDYQTRLPHNWLIWPMISYEYLDYYPPNSLFGNMFYFQLIITKRF